MAPFTRIVLPNGLRVILVPQPKSFATTAAVLVEAGSKYETKALNGISHFLEHMCFKGTTKRPNAMAIASELDGLGAMYNAFTGQEYTSYYAKVKSEFMPRAFDVVADLYLNPVFDEKEIEKEKGVIVEEINMYEDLPSRRVQELFTELLYGDQPAGWTIAGRKEVVRGLRRDDFITYRGAHYVPQATVVVVSGAFREKEATWQIEHTFGHLVRGRKGLRPKVVERQSAPAELVRHKESDQTHLVMGFRAFGISDPRRYALQVLADILGGGMSSRLFQRIREELGAAYYVRAEADLSSDHGVLAMAAGVQHEKAELVVKEALKEFARFREEKVGAAELKRAKDHLAGALFLGLETSDELGYFYGGQEIARRNLIMPEEAARRIGKVTAMEVQALARALFRPKGLNLALIGPFKGKSFRGILRV